MCNVMHAQGRMSPPFTSLEAMGGSHAGPQAIVLTGLEKSWPGPAGPVHAVRGIDVTIERGETVALLGPNGAGKSTTIDMILGLARPDGGTVEVLGRSPADAVRQGLVGAMLQTGDLIRNLTLRELIEMAASLYENPMDVDQTLALAGLDDAAEQLTQKISGGQTQRARFAVAVVANPEVLILDEPTVAMDVEARRAFWVAMRRFAAQQKTVIFATHYLEEADANADRAVLMAHGRVVADGPTTEIKSRVGSRTIRATLPDVPVGELAKVPGVASGDRHGDAVILACFDSDRAIRVLLDRYPETRDIEIAGAGLEEAFLQLTGEPGEDQAASGEPLESIR
jgi:ABC-2 type transport system ATP-binding protein